MKSAIFQITAASCLFCLIGGCSGCSGNPGVAPPSAEESDVIVERTPRETEDMIKTYWERFAQAEEAREQKRALTRLGALGADAESEISKIQAIADDEKNDEKVRETANLTIEKIKKAVEEAAE